MVTRKCSQRTAHGVDEIAVPRFNTEQKSGVLMGVMPRKSGDSFIITSDRIVGELPNKQAPKRPLTQVFQFWTGDSWSTSLEAATTFSALDAADDYIRANFTRVMG